ncbi:MAG: lysostaphin resistance A-like protein [Mycoplasmatales bacterium]
MFKKSLLTSIMGLLIITIFFLIQRLSLDLTFLFWTPHNIVELLGRHFTILACLEFIWVVSLIVIYRKSIIRSIKRNLSLNGIIKIFCYYVLAMALALVASIIISFFFESNTGTISDNQSVLNFSVESTKNIFLIVSITVFAPIIEEFVFRYVFISKVFNFMNKYLAAIISALCFSFLHVGFEADIGTFIYLMLGYFPLALTLSIVYAKEEDLFIPMLLHAGNNILSVIIMFQMMK